MVVLERNFSQGIFALPSIFLDTGRCGQHTDDKMFTKRLHRDAPATATKPMAMFATKLWQAAGCVGQDVNGVARPTITGPAGQDSRSRANYSLLCGTSGVAGP